MKIKGLFRGLTIAAFTVVIIGSTAIAQDGTYVFQNPEVVDNIDSYMYAIDKADFDTYRLPNDSRILTFESGLKVELYSEEKLMDLGLPVNNNLINRNKNTPVESTSIFSLSPEGIILELVPSAAGK